jgi:hypothetical protein
MRRNLNAYRIHFGRLLYRVFRLSEVGTNSFLSLGFVECIYRRVTQGTYFDCR